MITSRRSFITGLVSFVAAPAIVRASSLMPVKNFSITNIGSGYPEMAFDIERIVVIAKSHCLTARYCFEEFGVGYDLIIPDNSDFLSSL